MDVLKFQAYAQHPRVVPTPSLSLTDRRSWFREVHKTWKLTCFEKLLSRLDATFVQINASNRRLSTLRPFKAIVQDHELGRPALGFVDSDAHCRPREVDPADLAKYREHVDPRQL